MKYVERFLLGVILFTILTCLVLFIIAVFTGDKTAIGVTIFAGFIVVTYFSGLLTEKAWKKYFK